MGMDLRAILVCGIDLHLQGNRPRLPWENCKSGFDEFFAAKLGVPKPNEAYSGSNDRLYRVYWDRKKEVLRESGVELVSYGFGGNLGEILGISESLIAAEDWSVQPLRGDSPLSLATRWYDVMRRACETLGIAYQDPEWILTAYYG